MENIKDNESIEWTGFAVTQKLSLVGILYNQY